MTDQALLQRYVIHRDAEAFAELVHKYQRLVLATCRRQLHSAADIDDAVQETFLRLAQKAREIDSNPGAWLHRCATNVSVDRNRRRGARRRHETQAAIPQDALSPGQRELAELREHVDAAVSKLPDDQRELIVQRFFVGRSQGELAMEHGVAPSTMTYRLDKAIEALRHNLKSIGCLAGVVVIEAMLDAERAAAAVPQALTANIMKIGLKGVAGGPNPVLAGFGARLLAAAAMVVVTVLGLAWWLTRGQATMATAGPVTPSARVAVAKAPGTAPVVPAGRYFDFQAVDTVTGKGIPDATLTIEMATEMKRASLRKTTAKTDGEGKHRIALPEKELVMLRVGVKKDGLVPMSVMWQAGELRGGLVPSYVLKMEQGTEMGGIVQDEQGKPVAGASVRLLVPGSDRGSDHPRADIWDYEVKTDAQGRWHCGIMPAKLDEVLLKLSHPQYQSDATYGASGQPTVEELRRGTFVLVLKQGLTVAGSVVDAQSGKGIAGVTVRQGDDRWGSNYPKTKTDAAGSFRFANAKPGKMTLTAQGPGFMPDLMEVEARPGMPAVTFRLKQGAGFVGQVVDANGTPIQGAQVVADTWRTKRTIQWTGKTDADGRFEWEDAPADEVEYGILKEGFVANRNARGTSGEEVPRFTLVRQTKIRGKVTDAQTDKPIAAFRAVLGSRSKNGDWFWEERRSRTLTDGWYEATTGEPADEYAVRIDADGYLPVITQSVKAGSADVTRDVKLKRGSGPAGVVRDADAKPLAGVRIAVANADTTVRINNGKMETHSRSGRGKPMEFLSDAEGRYSVPPQMQAATLVAISEKGMATMVIGPSTAELDVTLQPWASAEGTLRWETKVLTNTSLSASPESNREEQLAVSSSATTDAQGHFTLEHLPATRLNVHRLGKEIEQRSEMFFQIATLEPKPGEKTHCDIGGDGARVAGRIDAPEAMVGKHIYVSLFPQQPRMEYPENWDQMSEEERATWAKQWEQTHRGVRRTDTQGIFAEPDGSVAFCDVKPGAYIIWASAMEKNESIAGARCDVNVAIGTPDTVVDVGVLKLEPAHTLKVGENASPLELKTMDGATVKLSELRGKWVLVTPWTTLSSRPGHQSLAEAVKSVWEKHASGGKLETLTLLFDQRKVWAQRYLAKQPLPGAVVYAGEESGTKTDDLTPYTRANGVLIDPEGVVRAVSLMEQPDMAAAVGTAMQK